MSSVCVVSNLVSKISAKQSNSCSTIYGSISIENSESSIEKKSGISEWMIECRDSWSATSVLCKIICPFCPFQLLTNTKQVLKVYMRGRCIYKYSELETIPSVNSNSICANKFSLKSSPSL